MNIHRIWLRAFEREFLELRAQGLSEDAAIELVEHRATEAQDRYVDSKLEERKLAEPFP